MLSRIAPPPPRPIQALIPKSRPKSEGGQDYWGNFGIPYPINPLDISKMAPPYFRHFYLGFGGNQVKIALLFGEEGLWSLPLAPHDLRLTVFNSASSAVKN